MLPVVRVLLVDDHELFREGLKAIVANTKTGIHFDEAAGVEQGLERAKAGNYDLILLDLKMPGVKGMDGLQAMREAVPDTPVVVLSGEEDSYMVRAAIELGAMGFIPKSSTPAVLMRAMDLIAAGGVYLPPAVLDSRPAAPLQPKRAPGEPKLPGITARQMDVLRWVIQGKPNKVIARELNISEGTVKAHLSSAMHVLGAKTRTEAVYAAAKLGLRLT